MNKQGVIALCTALLFIVLIGITVFTLQYRVKQDVGDFIANDVAKLSALFEAIDKECTILSFDYQKNHINFLNVGTFKGSEVGPMNLAYPDKWQGPYLDDNPTMQQKEYEVVVTKKGHFIVPGDGVKLPNGKVIGVDLIFDENADIAHMMHEDLHYNKRSLAAYLPLHSFDKVVLPKGVVRQSFE